MAEVHPMETQKKVRIVFVWPWEDSQWVSVALQQPLGKTVGGFCWIIRCGHLCQCNPVTCCQCAGEHQKCPTTLERVG